MVIITRKTGNRISSSPSQTAQDKQVHVHGLDILGSFRASFGNRKSIVVAAYGYG